MISQELISLIEAKLNSKVSIIKEEQESFNSVFKVIANDKLYFLKIGNNLKPERERLDWLKGKIPVPEVIDFYHTDNKDALLLSALLGKNLLVMSKEWSREKVIDKLVEVLKKMHQLDIKDCPFGEANSHKVLVHGDACLPNFIFHNDDFSGYIDVGELRIDDVDIDLGATCWSLDYNFGDGYDVAFLKKYGIVDAGPEMAKTLRDKFELSL